MIDSSSRNMHSTHGVHVEHTGHDVDGGREAAIQSVFGLHVFLHLEENERAEFFPLASSSGVAAEFVRIVRSRAGLLAFLVFPILPAGETADFEQFKIWLQR
jgi:hypothetical protein